MHLLLRHHGLAYPTPVALSYWWNLGFIAGMALLSQMVTGIFLAMHYLPSAHLAFASVEHIMRDVSGGWLLRYWHANGASLMFAVVYLHMAKGLYHSSFTAPRQYVWLVGVMILFIMIITAFIGYVLPWGQMSLWGATVITNLASAVPLVGSVVVQWLWGGFTVSDATLVRFYSLHYALPFGIAALALVHLQLLHAVGSSNPVGVHAAVDTVSLYPAFVLKDIVGMLAVLFAFVAIVAFASNMLGHCDNYVAANHLVTPVHIVPEWYFLPYYAVLRSVPHKLMGVVCMMASIAVLAVLPLLQYRKVRALRCHPASRALLMLVGFCWLTLGWVGGMPVDEPFVLIGQCTSIYYFCHWLCIVPLSDAIESMLFQREEGKAMCAESVLILISMKSKTMKVAQSLTARR
nr:cytochrome b [Rufusia pilicola]